MTPDKYKNLNNKFIDFIYENDLNDLCNFSNPNFYDPNPVLHSADRNGEIPEIYMILTNRGGGKTYGFCSILMEFAKKTGGKFALLCRNKDEVGSIASSMLKPICIDKYPDTSISEELCYGGRYSKIWASMKGEDEDEPHKEQHIGYVIPLNLAYRLKNVSGEFVDIDVMFFDEFQTDRPLTKECSKLMNVYDTVSRGGQALSRFVPVILCSNSLSIENDYFMELGITKSIQQNTKWMRGDGYILHRCTMKNVSDARASSAFHRAFSGNKEGISAADNSWLNDDYSLVCKPAESWGRSYYFMTLFHKNQYFGVREYANGIIYINRSPDMQFQTVYSLGDMYENISVLSSEEPYRKIRGNLFKGNVRFSDLTVKTIMFDFLCIKS